VMMGEFGWYADIPLEKFSTQMRSGKLVLWLWLWYFVYMVLVVQVLLNMTLAIILEKYIEIANEMHHQLDAPPIWIQIRRYREFKKTTKGYISMKQMLLMLENDADPAHPEDEYPVVQVLTLMKAFPGMQIWQATWLYCWLEVKKKVRTEKEEGQEDDEQLADLEEEAASKIQEIFDAILTPAHEKGAQTEEEKKAHIKAHQDAYESDREKALSEIEKSLNEVHTGVAKLRRDQDKLSRKIDQMITAFPGYKPRSKGVADAVSKVGRMTTQARSRDRDRSKERDKDGSKDVKEL